MEAMATGRAASHSWQTQERRVMTEGLAKDGLERVTKGRVVVAGAGGLACAVSAYLNVAGGGKE